MRSIRYIEVVFCKVVVKLFFLVLDFLHTNPLPKSYNSTSLFKIPIYRVLYRVL